jgi:hypothetical protein
VKVTVGTAVCCTCAEAGKHAIKHTSATNRNRGKNM